jgi:2-phospho-L-lactate/phosphoenolpyruvate guanylyltransferase
MKAILIPVKEFCEAKKRLAPHFSAAERAALAEAMCADFFRVVAAVRGADAVFVASKEPRALARAREFGWETIVESRQISESDSVDGASRYCAERGVQSLLRLPIDLPLAQASDIEELLAQSEAAPSAILVPSSDGTGTNALLRSPATLFPSHFGTGSFALHLEEAERCGARTRVFRNPRLELDIDELADLQKVSAALRADSSTYEWLSRGWKLEAF